MYTAYFGLREPPFDITPNPRFFYLNSVYQEAYASLLYGICERKGFLVLSGEVGTGKTTTLKVLMQNVAATVRVLYIHQPYLTFEELVSLLCEELGFPVPGVGLLQKVQALQAFLVTQLQLGRIVVLLIDEAQNLTEETLGLLRLLSNLETATDKLLQIVLVGQPELERKLSQPELRPLKQRISLQRRLAPLKHDEVGAYIHYRLRIVGCERQRLFPPEAIKRIAGYSQGIPRLINILCDNALLNAYGTSRKTISVAMIDEVAADHQLAEPVATPGDGQPHARPHRSPDEAGTPRRDAPVALRRRRLAWVGVGLLVATLLFGAWMVVGEPVRVRECLVQLGRTGENLLELIGERLVPLHHKLTAQLAVFHRHNAEAEKAQAPLAPDAPLPLTLASQGQSVSALPGKSVALADPVKGEVGSVTETQPERSIIVPSGATVMKLATMRYGERNTLLALDLLEEFNPHIANLNVVRVGEKLQLPPLTQATLLRQQPNGTYHLILAVVATAREAEQFAQGVRRKGYTVRIAPRRVTDALLLFRVEIEALDTHNAAQQAWDTALVQRWFPFADDPRWQERPHGQSIRSLKEDGASPTAG